MGAGEHEAGVRSGCAQRVVESTARSEIAVRYGCTKTIAMRRAISTHHKHVELTSIIDARWSQLSLKS